MKIPMLTRYTPRIIERTCTDKQGRVFRLVFEIAYSAGEYKARLVSATPLEASSAHETSLSSQAASVFLPVISIQTAFGGTVQRFFDLVLSPFTTLSLITSQPTRAPSIA
jgi:hypothetical protein